MRNEQGEQNPAAAPAAPEAGEPRAKPNAERGTKRGSAIAAESSGVAVVPEKQSKKKKKAARSVGELSEKELAARESRTLFVGNVPLQWDKKQVRAAIRAAVGEAYSGPMTPIWFRALPLEDKWTRGKLRKAGSILRQYSDASDAKHAYVVLGDPEDVTTLRHAVNGHVADDTHTLRADGVGSAAKLQTFDRKRSVFVGNLPPSASEADLRAVFRDVGAIDAVRIVRDRVSKACKGIAFVLFAERKSVKTALGYWGVELKGREIRVTKVEQRDGQDDEGPISAGQAWHPAENRIKRKWK